MAKSNTFENDVLKLYYHGTPIANIADNAAVSPLTNLYLALHTADPGEAGDQTTNEVTYTGCFNISGNEVTLVADADFPNCTAGPQTATHFSVGVASAGASKILHRGAITPNIAILVGGFPRLKAATKITES
jgi:hypothetical protein